MCIRRYLPASATIAGAALLLAGLIVGYPLLVLGGTTCVIGVVLLALNHVDKRQDQIERRIIEANAQLQAKAILERPVEQLSRQRPRHAQRPRRDRSHLRVIQGGLIGVVAWVFSRARENAVATGAVATLALAVPVAGVVEGNLPSGGDSGPARVVPDRAPKAADVTIDGEPESPSGTPTPAAAIVPGPTPTLAGTEAAKTPILELTPLPEPIIGQLPEPTAAPTTLLSQPPSVTDPDRFTGRDKSPPCQVDDLTDKLPGWLTNGGDDSECS